MSVVRVGVVGTDNLHAFSLCAFVNGWGESVPFPVRLPGGGVVPNFWLWGSLLRRLEVDGASGVPVGGARVVSVWGADVREAELVARGCGVERVCGRPEEVVEGVDAVMVLSESPESHGGFARLALERGLPTFIDKPLAESVESAGEIAGLADRCGARWFSGSALRWSPELLAAREFVRARWGGGVRGVSVVVPAGAELYGIHAVEVANLFLGRDVVSVRGMAAPGREVVLLEYRDGCTAVLEHVSFLRYPQYVVGIYGQDWYHEVRLEPPNSLLALTRQIVGFFRGGPAPVTPEEAIDLLGITNTAQHTLKRPCRSESKHENISSEVLL